MAKRDDIAKEYAASKRIGAGCLVLFWVNAIFAFATLLPISSITNIAFIAQSTTAIVFVALRCLDDYHCWYLAERARRRHLVEDALGLDLTNSSSEGYYNNSLAHGEKRLIADAFESIFFTSRIVKAMLPGALAKGTMAVLTFLVITMAFGSSSLLPLVTQTVFSSYLVTGTIETLVYNNRLEQLYSEMYRLCVTTGMKGRVETQCALVNVEEYECLKAHFKIRLSERLYKKHNPTLSREWADVEKKIRLSRSLKRSEHDSAQ